MAYQRVPETVAIVYVMDLNSHEYGYRFYAKKSGGYDQAALTALATTMDAAGGGQFAGIQSAGDAYLRTEIIGLDAENDLSASNNNNAVIGSIGYYPLPMNVAFCITQRSGYSGRSARGRFYFAGIPRSFRQDIVNQTDLLYSVYADAILAVVDGIRSAIQGLGIWDPVLVSRYHDGAKRDEAVLFPWLTSEYRTLKLASQRRRLVR